MEIMQISSKEIFLLTRQALARELDEVHEQFESLDQALEQRLTELDQEFEELTSRAKRGAIAWPLANAQAQQTRIKLNDLTQAIV